MSSDKIYSPAWWLPGGHLQTLWGKLGRRRRRLDLTRGIWPTPDRDEVEVYRLDGTEGFPHLLILHGLEGSLRSHYVNGLLSAAADASWGAHLLVFRSCGETINKTRRFYHSGDSEEIAFALSRVLAEIPEAPLCAVGVSLGGNVLLKYLGERGQDVPSRLRAAAAISVPYELSRSAERINHGFSRSYQRFFLKTLKAKTLLKGRMYSNFPDGETVRRIGTLVEFDDIVTAPLHGFGGAADYYRRASSIGYLPGVRIPTLLLSAYDDPFLPAEVLTAALMAAKQSPAIQVEFHERGGHVGFVSGAVPWRPFYYMEHRVMRFFRSVLGLNTTDHER